MTSYSKAYRQFVRHGAELLHRALQGDEEARREVVAMGLFEPHPLSPRMERAIDALWSVRDADDNLVPLTAEELDCIICTLVQGIPTEMGVCEVVRLFMERMLDFGLGQECEPDDVTGALIEAANSVP